MKRTLLAAISLLAVSPSAFAQTDRGFIDCSQAPALNRPACEARNAAVTHCGLETDERFVTCVSEALRNPPPAQKPGFSKGTSSKPPAK